MAENIECPICEEGTLHPALYEDEFERDGKPVHVTDLECYVCDACGAKPIFEEQARRNHLRIVDAKRRADNLLTGDEIRAIRKQLGLTQQDAALLFGGGANAFSKYERGDVIQSVAMDRLLRLASKHPHMVLRELMAIVETPSAEEWLAAVAESVPNYDAVWLTDKSAHYSALPLRGAGRRTVVTDEDWNSRNAA